MEETYQIQVWPGISTEAKKRDVNIIYFTGTSFKSPYFPSSQMNIVYDLVSSDLIDGLIVFSGPISNFIGYVELCEFLKKYQNLPMVSLAIKIPEVPSILVDNSVGFREVISHLIVKHNYKRIAFIRGPVDHPEANARYETYLSVLDEFNIKYDPELVVNGDFIEISGIKAIDILLDQHKVKFDAIVSSNDDMAFGALKALQRRNLFVPNDIAIVGFDDVSRSTLCNPPLTTVKQPLYEQGKKALEMILDMIEEKDIADEIRLPTEAIYRRSCGCFPERFSQITQVKNPQKYPSPYTSIKEIEQEILSELFQIAKNHDVNIDSSVLKKILESFILGIKESNYLLFISVLDGILRKEMIKNRRISYWHQIFSKLYDSIIPFFYFDNAVVSHIENLILRARNLLEEILFQRESIRREEDKENLLMINTIRQVLMSTYSIKKLSESINNELPKIGIKSFYFSLFEDYSGPTTWSRLISAYTEKGFFQLDLEKGGKRFKTKNLVPKDYLPKNRQYSLIAETLFFRDENIFGFIVFEQPEDITEVEILSRNIGIALKGTLLIQERELLLKKLAYSNKELEEFASIVAHDLKQPLMVIMASLEMLKETNTNKLDSNSIELIDFSIEGSNRMKKMITDLLNFSRVTTSKMEFIEIDLESILSHVLSDLKVLIDEAKASITHDPLPTIFGSKTLLIQLFENLINNAIKFRGQKTPQVHIGAEMKNSKWIFSVKDNGIGIDKKNYNNIFQIFFRLHTNEEYKGTGIGLAICKKIVEKHDGKIWVESELGKGSTFVIELPKKKKKSRTKKNHSYSNVLI